MSWTETTATAVDAEGVVEPGGIRDGIERNEVRGALDRLNKIFNA